MNTSVDNIIGFLKELSGLQDIKSESDIFADLGMTGDDFHEMIDKYSKRYSVNMEKYLWYFHTNEEGFNTGALFFKPPYKRVKRISITPQLLTEFANKGIWDMPYPDHNLPKRRYDIIVNQILTGLFVLIIITVIAYKLIN